MSVFQAGQFAPRPSEVAFNYAGQPIYTRGGLLPSKRLFSDILNPSPYLPVSSIIRDPFWWNYPLLRPFRPYSSWGRSPFYLRDSYLSPVKRSYLWDKHPIRPFGKSLSAQFPVPEPCLKDFCEDSSGKPKTKPPPLSLT